MIISNSEVDTFLRCRKQHWYQYVLGLYPRKLSRPNHIGLLGHHILEVYYRYIKEGFSRVDAFHAGMNELIAAHAHVDSDVVALVSQRFMQYYEYYPTEDFDIVDVEGVYKTPLNDRITYGLTLDLLVKYHTGPWRGQYVVIDHKFKYNFLTADENSMHVQTYKYIWTLRKLGFPIKRALINQIRYREDIRDIDKLFSRIEMNPKTPEHIDNIMAEHLKVSEEIYTLKREPVAVSSLGASRRLNGNECKMCYFRLPCHLELIGKDPSGTLASMYSPSDPHTFYRQYGY